MAGSLIKQLLAECLPAAAFINRVVPLVSGISYRMCWPYYILNLQWRGNKYCYVHQDNLQKVMCNTGGIRLKAGVFVHDVPMTCCGYHLPYQNILRLLVIQIFCKYRPGFSKAA